MGEADREREALAWHLQAAQSAHARAAQDLEAAQSGAWRRGPRLGSRV